VTSSLAINVSLPLLLPLLPLLSLLFAQNGEACVGCGVH
jgi:hypothetical protein